MNINHIRTAIVKSENTTLATVERYLPNNYQAHQTTKHGILIVGEDEAGWTLDGYVIPRLASGMIFAEELSAV